MEKLYGQQKQDEELTVAQIMNSLLQISGLNWRSRENYYFLVIQFNAVQSLSRVRLFATPWTIAPQASLSITNSRNLPKIMSIESVMPSNHLILCES